MSLHMETLPFHGTRAALCIHMYFPCEDFIILFNPASNFQILMVLIWNTDICFLLCEIKLDEPIMYITR